MKTEIERERKERETGQPLHPSWRRDETLQELLCLEVSGNIHGAVGCGWTRIQGSFSDSVETSGFLNSRNSKWPTQSLTLGQILNPSFVGKQEGTVIKWNTCSRRGPLSSLMWSVCSVQGLYRVLCKPSFEFFYISLSLASWNLWLLVHYQGNSPSKEGATSIGYKYNAISLSSALL